jgi:hypothetical protein
MPNPPPALIPNDCPGVHMYEAVRPVSTDGVPTGVPSGPYRANASVLPAAGWYESEPPLVLTDPVLVPVNLMVACRPFPVSVTSFAFVSSTVITPLPVMVMIWPAPPPATTVIPFCTLEPDARAEIHLPTTHGSSVGVGVCVGLGVAVRVGMALEVAPVPPQAARNIAPIAIAELRTFSFISPAGERYVAKRSSRVGEFSRPQGLCPRWPSAYCACAAADSR